MKKITGSLILFLIIGCNSVTNEIESGTFEVYENDSLVGQIYRFGNYQIEQYVNGVEFTAQIEHRTDSTYLLRAYEKMENGLDTIIWLNKYKSIDKNKFKVLGTPFNADIDYKHEVVLLKVNEEINKKHLNQLKALNEN